MPKVTTLDHLVLTVADIDATADFYERAFGMQRDVFRPADGTTRVALKFGRQKINLHKSGAEFDPKALAPTKGSADLCFLSDTPVAGWLSHFAALGLEVVEGPVRRTGATGPILSVYLRDPDGNLIEVANAV